MNASDMERFRTLVQKQLGLVFDASRLDALAETLYRQSTAHGDDCSAYLQRLSEARYPDDTLRALARELTVTETYFFRAPQQIRAFVECALPQHLAALAGRRNLRVLSAGCASGEEPYSLAMAICEAAPWSAEAISIVAVDINPAMLQKALTACYSEWSLRELDRLQRARWFRASGSCWRLDERVCRSVVFEERNLTDENLELWQPGSWDAVFCRNMLMYFDPSNSRRLVARMASSLVPGGHLFLGHAETLRGLSDDFHLCHTHGTFYYRRKQSEAHTLDAYSVESMPSSLVLPVFDRAWIETIDRATERIDSLVEGSRDLGQAVVDCPVPEQLDLDPVLELLRRERYGQALDELNGLPAAQSERAEVLLLRAVSAVHGGALDEAEGACCRLLEQDQFNAGAHYVLALCREGVGDTSGAAEEDALALYIDPEFAMARLHLGLLARRKNEPEAARRELSLALSALFCEDASRLLLFGGGFSRDALIALCEAELTQCGRA